MSIGLRAVAGVLASLIAGASELTAQQSVAPTPVVAPATVALPSPHLSRLRRAAVAGDGGLLADAARSGLVELSHAELTPECCDLSRDYFLVIFPVVDSSRAPAIVTVLVHDPMPDSASLPGLHGATGPRLYELFVAEPGGGTVLQSTYTTVREENEAAGQLEDFVPLVLGKLALPIAISRTSARPQARTGQHVLAVRFSRVLLPEPGRLMVKQFLTFADPMGHVLASAAFVNEDQKAALADEYGASEPGPSCSRFSDVLRESVDGAAQAAPCGRWPLDLSTCAKKLAGEVARTANSYLSAAPACPSNIAAALVPAMMVAAQDIKPITATTTFGNRGRVRYGFGLAAGYLAWIDIDAAHPRAQLQSGRIVATPFTRQLAMASVNLTPWGYDPQRPSPSFAERARLFLGPILTPNFGLGGGFAFEISRPVALNIGYARLWFDTPKVQETLDQAPTVRNRAAPFALRSTGAAFFGVSYNMK